MKTIFVAYPYDLKGFRQPLERAAKDVATLAFADDRLTNQHILEKITDMLKTADLCLFDLSKENANVALELGIAIGLNLNFRILLNQSEKNVFSDMQGWDQLRYVDLDDLEFKLGSLLRHEETFKRRQMRFTDQELAVQPYLHVDLHGGSSGPDGSFLEGFVRNAGHDNALEPMLRLPGLQDIRLGGIMKREETVPLNRIRYDDKAMYRERLEDPMASVEYEDMLGNLCRQEGRVTQSVTPGGSILTYSINFLGRPFKISERLI